MGADEWTDVTEEYRRLAAGIPQDMMVASDDLDLVKVMHALEAMDKTKMDCGVGYQERKGLVEVVEGGLVNKAPSLLQQYKLMEYLVEAEGGYLGGGLLPTTLFTCVFFHDRTLIEGVPFLHAYIEALVATVADINSTVLLADVREDEEFTPISFGVDVGEGRPAPDAMDQANPPLVGVITSASASARLAEETDRFEAAYPGVFSDAADGAGAPEELGASRLKVMAHLARLRIAWLDAMAAFGKRDLAGARAQLEKTRGWVAALLKLRAETDPEDAAAAAADKPAPKHADPAAHPEEGAQKSKAKTRPPPNEHVTGMVFADAQYWVSMPYLFACLPLPSYRKTLESFDLVLREHAVVCDVEDKCTDLMSLVEYVETCFEFAPSSTQPHLLSRSRLMTLLYEKNKVLGKFSMTDLIMGHLVDDLGLTLCDQVIVEPHLPTNLVTATLYTAAGKEKKKEKETEKETEKDAAEPEAINSPENASMGYASHQEHFMRFVDRFGRCLLLYIYALCHNKARLRRKLANLFVDWGHVQGTAWDVDRVVFDGHLLSDPSVPEEIAQRSAPLSTVVYDFVLRLMALFLTTGFELDLYHASEMQGVVWYVQYITALRLDSMNHMQKTRNPTAEELKLYSKKRSKAPAGLPLVYAKRELRRPPIYRMQLLEATSFVHKGVLALCAACEAAGMLRGPAGTRERRNKYCSEESRFEHRMLPFMQLMKPRFVRFKSYKMHSAFDKPCGDVLNDALGWLRFCKAQLLDQVKRVPSLGSPADQRLVDELSNVAKANMVSIVLIQSALGKAEGGEVKDTVEFDWTYSKRLPLVKLVKAK
eukprot:TRINITY_DN11681_c1_g2_i1.p1 TRINITY_DN11681_c1_g2~~TRINITY_DN11681_c1_g2_i1.p1  ORF type:complete len:822 (+),score=349.73 TRINITY_DN11681_c1_g2_i1:110-2575(+)